MRKNGSVLIGVLWCIALLSIVVISTLHSSSLALRIGHHQTDSIQAHYLALAGAERAKALLFHDAARRRQSHVNYDGQLSDAPSLFQDTPFAPGTCRSRRPNPRPAAPRRGLRCQGRGKPAQPQYRHQRTTRQAAANAANSPASNPRLARPG